jgi:acid phosphatase class B
MTVFNWTEADSARVEEIWSEYQRRHDLSEKFGETAGIDPASGRIWFGDSIQDVIAQRDAEGRAAPLFFMRVGSATYYRKGGCR